ncbi:MAG: sigma-70 family RNA polymerase sigma factor [Deltaproteobacteria bacterium]|nr:sigma-70 family RNA polymerase sigma factor [Deltaproteobacteria bacterium]
MVRRFTPLVYRVVRRMLPSDADAQDASQQTFVRIHRSFGSYDPARPLAAWIARIAYHVALRRLGARADRLVAPIEPDALGELAVAPAAEGPESRETAALLDAALGRLSAQDRGLVMLRYREGLTDAELAEATGMPIGTVKTRLFRARAELRRLLGPALQEG